MALVKRTIAIEFDDEYVMYEEILEAITKAIHEGTPLPELVTKNVTDVTKE